MDTNDLRRGQTIAHYRIIDKIGEGGMASVYKAMDLKLGRTVALKLIALSEDLDEETRMRFIREARLAAKLNHPGITTIYEINEDEGLGFISMEYIEGWTLTQILAEEGPLKLERFFDVSRAICAAIAEAHRQGIVHRDLKLPNIMQTTRGDIKVMDFGIAKTFGEAELGQSESITQRGMTLGTVEYMSPEQILGEPIDGRSDVFATGVLFFELLTGKLPFVGDSQMQTFRAILKLPPRKLRELKPDLPERLEQILERALQKKPADRHPTIDALAAELKSLYKQMFAPAVKKGISIRAALALASVLVAAGLFGGWHLFGSRGGLPGLAVIYFQNQSRPDDVNRLGRMVTNLLMTSLSADGSLAVLSNQKLYDVLKQLGQADATVISREVAAKVARTAGVSLMVTGSIAEAGERYRLNSELIDVHSGKTLESQQVEGKGEMSALFELVDQLSQQVLADLKLQGPADTGAPKSRLSEATTSSPEAYREYVLGLDLLNRYNLPESQAAFKKALDLDPNFTLAYYRLAMTQVWWEPDPAVIKKALEKLNEGLPKLSLRDREMAEAFIHLLRQDFKNSLASYQKLNEKYTDEKEILYWLGDSLYRLGKMTDAIPYYERVLELDRDSVLAPQSLLRSYNEEGNLDRGLQFARRFLAGHEGHARAHGLLGDVLRMRGQMQAALQCYQKAVAIDPGFRDAIANMAGVYVLQERYAEALPLYEKSYDQSASSQNVAFQNMGCAAVQAGQFAEAQRQFDRKRSLGESLSDKRILATAFQDKSFAYFAAGDLDAALDAIQKAHELFGGEVRAYWRAYKGWLHLRRGEIDQARAEAEKIPDTLTDNPFRQHLRGWILVTEGKAAEGVPLLENTGLQKKTHYAPVNLFALSEGYHALGRLDKAQAALAEIIGENFLIPIGSVSIVNRVSILVYPMAYYRLGLIAEQRGDVAVACNAYTRFLQLWSDAPETPEKADARRRRQVLLAQPGAGLKPSRPGGPLEGASLEN